MSVFADTNILARLLLDDVPGAAQQVQQWIAACSSQEIVILDAVFVELFFIIEAKNHYHRPRSHSVAFFETLVRVPQFLISNRALEAFQLFRTHPKLDFMDCLLAASAELDTHRVLTFDKDLQKFCANYSPRATNSRSAIRAKSLSSVRSGS